MQIFWVVFALVSALGALYAVDVIVGEMRGLRHEIREAASCIKDAQQSV